MLFYLQSTDPDNNSTIKYSTNIMSGRKKQFRILQVSFIASFLITTDEDYIEFNVIGGTHKICFTNQTTYDKDELPDLLTNMFTSIGILVSYNNIGTLTMSCSNGFIISDASHRVKMLLGLYNKALPLQSKLSINPAAGINTIVIPSVPFTCYGNNLYLRSRVSSVVGVNNANTESYTSLCANINEFFVSGLPVISKTPGPYVIINSYDLSNLEFTLVDCKNEPIKMTSPLFLVLEINDV